MSLRHPVGCLMLKGHFSQKSPIISGSFAENDLQLEASDESSPPCTHVFCTCAHCLRHFRQKSPIISGSFAENDLQLKASDGSSPPCTYMCMFYYRYLLYIMPPFLIRTLFKWRYTRCSMLQCVAVCRSVLQCVAVCCSVLQCVAV